MSAFANGAAYDRFMGRWSRRLGIELAGFANLRGRARVLDVGCGTGALAAAILAANGHAEVVGIDPSETFVAHAREHGADPRARFEVGDAQKLHFPDGAFDAALAMLVLNFVPDPPAAAAEMRRVTRPGGCVAACVWDYGDGMTMLRELWDAAVALDPAAAARHESVMPLTGSGQLGVLWRALGLQAVREQALEFEMRFADFADYWEPFLAGVGPAGGYVAALEPERRSALEARLRTRLWNDRPREPRELPARAWAVAGIVARGAAAR